MADVGTHVHRTVASRGAIGGSANERGSEVRAGIAAWAMAHAARGRPLPRLAAMTGVPVAVRCETDETVDDLAIVLSGDARSLSRAKRLWTFAPARGHPWQPPSSRSPPSLRTGSGL